jgi:hypothetical protein
MTNIPIERHAGLGLAKMMTLLVIEMEILAPAIMIKTLQDVKVMIQPILYQQLCAVHVAEETVSEELLLEQSLVIHMIFV